MCYARSCAAREHGAEAPEQPEHRINLRGVCDTESLEGLERACGFAGLGTRVSKARDAIGARARRGFRRLQIGPLESAPELVGESAVSAR